MKQILIKLYGEAEMAKLPKVDKDQPLRYTVSESRLISVLK